MCGIHLILDLQGGDFASVFALSHICLPCPGSEFSSSLPCTYRLEEYRDNSPSRCFWVFVLVPGSWERSTNRKYRWGIEKSQGSALKFRLHRNCWCVKRNSEPARCQHAGGRLICLTAAAQAQSLRMQPGHYLQQWRYCLPWQVILMEEYQNLLNWRCGWEHLSSMCVC